MLKITKSSKGQGKDAKSVYTINFPDGPVEYASADAAFEALNAHEEAKEAEKAKPIAIKVNDRGQLVIAGNDRENWGAFPLQLHGYQFDLLVANWPEIQRIGEEGRKSGKLVHRWQDLRPSAKKAKSA